jgi:hypothetical protein
MPLPIYIDRVLVTHLVPVSIYFVEMIHSDSSGCSSLAEKYFDVLAS